MKKVIHERMVIYRHETQTVPSDVFLEVKLQGVVSFRRGGSKGWFLLEKGWFLLENLADKSINMSEHFETSIPLS